MHPGQTSIRKLLEREARSWHNLPLPEYDHATCALLDESIGDPAPTARIESVLALASATLRRNAPALIESRARCAELLLTLNSAAYTAALRPRIYLLFLLAWLRLGVAAASGPASISVAPDLPPGVALPSGADPDLITDPGLRQQARDLAARHADQVERWTAKQLATDHLRKLAALVRARRADSADMRDELKVLEAAMSLAPGLPPELRSLLENDAT